MIQQFIDLAERGYAPDILVRMGIRRLLKKRLASVDLGSPSANQARLNSLVEEFSSGPVALVPEKANEQHYEVPAELFVRTLGTRLKYSGCYWPDESTDLNQAEEIALGKSCEHAELSDGAEILELGCGWVHCHCGWRSTTQMQTLRPCRIRHRNVSLYCDEPKQEALRRI